MSESETPSTQGGLRVEPFVSAVSHEPSVRFIIGSSTYSITPMVACHVAAQLKECAIMANIASKLYDTTEDQEQVDILMDAISEATDGML